MPAHGDDPARAGCLLSAGDIPFCDTIHIVPQLMSNPAEVEAWRSAVDVQQQKQLDEQGYLILRDLLTGLQIEQILLRLEELWTLEGENAGEENYIEPGVRRLANLANKGAIFGRLSAHPQVLEIVQAIMGPDIRLAMVNARDVPPHTGVRMPFHMDSDKGRVRDEHGYSAATAIWMLDRFTARNGATALIPGSHLFGRSPKSVLADLNAAHPDEIVIDGRPGDALVFNGHCWHAGRPNRTGDHRRAILVHYLRSDVPRPANRRQHLDADQITALSARERELLGLDDRDQVSVFSSG